MRGLYLLLVCELLGRTFTPITCKPTLFFTWSVLRLSIQNIQIMRKILFLFIVVVFFYGCSKENEDKSNDAYQIEFVNGKEYTQTFYFGSHFIYSENNKTGTGCNIISSCNRLSFTIKDNEVGFYEICPPVDLRNEEIKLNENLDNQNFRYYLIADIHFSYPITSTLNMQLKSQWKIVIGRMEEYVYNGQIYNRLIIVE